MLGTAEKEDGVSLGRGSGGAASQPCNAHTKLLYERETPSSFKPLCFGGSVTAARPVN